MNFWVFINLEKNAMGTMDGILDTVSAVHPILPLLRLLKYHSTLVLVGLPDKPIEIPCFPLVIGKRYIL